MKLITRLRFVAPIALCAAAACSSEVAPTPDNSTTQQSAAACPEGGEQQREPRMFELVGDALAQANLSEEQRAAVEKIADQVRPGELAVIDARRGLMMGIAKQLESGSVDRCGLQDQIDALVSAREAAAPAKYKAIDALHTVLDSGQRERFVDALKGRLREVASRTSERYETLARDLNLSEEQKEHIQRILDKARARHEEAHQRAAAMLDAFKADEFSMEKVMPIARVGERSRKMAKEMVHLARKVADVLSPDQRAELAKKIETRITAQEACREGAAPPVGAGAAPPSGATPSAAPPSGATPSAAPPSGATPSAAPPSAAPPAGTYSAPPSGTSEMPPVGTSEQGLIVAGAYPGILGGMWSTGYVATYPSLYGYGYAGGFPYLGYGSFGAPYVYSYPFVNTLFW